MTTPRPPDRRVWDPAKVDDGARTLVDERTGEIIEVPPSARRAARPAARAARHDDRLADQRARQVRTNRAGIRAARTALPARPAPPGLERRPDPVGAYLAHADRRKPMTDWTRPAPLPGDGKATTP
jgi:hypothetical protein